MLLRMALDQGVTIPRLLVESALAAESGETRTERHETLAELFKICRLLGNIANNVNQLAKVANATGELGAELRATLEAARGAAMRVDRTIGALAVGRSGR